MNIEFTDAEKAYIRTYLLTELKDQIGLIDNPEEDEAIRGIIAKLEEAIGNA